MSRDIDGKIEKRTTLSLSLTEEDKRNLKMMAAQRNITVAAMIREWLAEHLDNEHITGKQVGEFIKKDDALKAVSECSSFGDALDAIDELPSVEAAPVIFAEWKEDRNTVFCTHCGFGTFSNAYYFKNGDCFAANNKPYLLPVCPYCGAIMMNATEPQKTDDRR